MFRRVSAKNDLEDLTTVGRENNKGERGWSEVQTGPPTIPRWLNSGPDSRRPGRYQMLGSFLGGPDMDWS